MGDAPICPYCNVPAMYVDSIRIFKKSYGMIWLCSRFPRCDARVGVHGQTKVPLGTMANGALRKKRHELHEILDPLWQSKKMARSDAYELLATLMNKPVDKTHIALFDEAECDFAREQLENWLWYYHDVQ